MILVEKLEIEGIPSLHIVENEKAQQQLPFVMFIHGFSGAKENNLHYAYLLAEKGFRVVLPEAIYHGERLGEMTPEKLHFHFWEIVINTIKELNVIKEFFEANELIDVGQIGVGGTSMGGIITLGALTQYNWIQSAVSLMGLPNFEAFAKSQIDGLRNKNIKLPLSDEEELKLLALIKRYDLSLQPEKLYGKSLLFWHGKQDSIVPYKFAFEFFSSLPKIDSSIEFITDQKAGHQVSREGVLKTVNWFEKHLKIKETCL